MTLNIDIAPTIERLAGVEPVPCVNGVDLGPLVSGENPPWRSEWFYEHLFEHPRVPKSEGVRTTDWKYMRFIDADPLYEEMYDLANDPYEYENLAKAPDYAKQLEHLRARREAWIENLESWRIDQPWQQPA
jgi:arylsulfatase A-like enzyme